MKRLEKMARRALYWAEIHRAAGDSDGVAFAMHRWRVATRRLESMVDAAFAPRIEITGGV